MILGFLGSKAGQAVMAVAAVLAAVGLIRRDAAQDARKDIKQEIEDDTRERVEKGNKAVADSRDDDPVERLRRNDGKW